MGTKFSIALTLMTTQISFVGAEDTTKLVEQVLHGCEEIQQRQSNLRISATVDRGDEPNYFIQDELEVSVLNSWCLCNLTDRKKRSSKPYFRARVGAFTTDYAFILKADTPGEEFRVDGIVLDGDVANGMPEKQIWGWWISSSPWAVGGFPLPRVLGSAEGTEVTTRELNGRQCWIFRFKPTDPEFCSSSIPEMELSIDKEWKAIAHWRYVYVTTVEGKDYYNIQEQENVLKEWAPGIVFPSRILEQGVSVNIARLEAAPVNAPVRTEVVVQDVEIGNVTDAVFRPSSYGVPDSLVFLESPRTPWFRLMIILLVMNGVGLLIYLAYRRREMA